MPGPTPIFRAARPNPGRGRPFLGCSALLRDVVAPEPIRPDNLRHAPRVQRGHAGPGVGLAPEVAVTAAGGAYRLFTLPLFARPNRPVAGDLGFEIAQVGPPGALAQIGRAHV